MRACARTPPPHIGIFFLGINQVTPSSAKIQSAMLESIKEFTEMEVDCLLL